MKVLLHGYLYTQNFGDILYAKMTYNKCLEKNYECGFLSSTSDDFRIDPKVLNELDNPNVALMSDIDEYDCLVMYGGGTFYQYMEDGYRRFLRFIFPILYFLKQNKPVYILCCEFNNICTKWLEPYLKYIVDNVTVCNCRNKQSYEYLKSLGCTKMNLIDDIILDVDKPNVGEKRQVLVHIYHKYLTKITKKIIIPAIKDTLPNYDIVFMCDENSDIESGELQKYGKCYNYKSTNDILTLIAESKIIITTKLHIGVVGVAFDKSVVCYSNNTKARNFYQDINELNRWNLIDKIKYNDIVEKLKMYENVPIRLNHHQSNVLDVLDNMSSHQTQQVDLVEFFDEITKDMDDVLIKKFRPSLIKPKKLSVELPTCTPENFEKNYKENFKYWSLLKDDICFNINFQNYIDEDIEKYISYIKSLGIEVRYIKTEYQKGSSIITLRENTHQIYPWCKYNMTIDDDIEIFGEKYIDGIRNIIDFFDKNTNPGAAIIANSCKNKMSIRHIPDFWYYGTDGGIIVRNRGDYRLFDKKYYGLLGCGQDSLLCISRILDGYSLWFGYCGEFDHYKHRVIHGKERHGWQDCEQQIHNLVDGLEHTIRQRINDNVKNIKTPIYKY